jgi:hypothetical protein
MLILVLINSLILIYTTYKCISLCINKLERMVILFWNFIVIGAN